MSDGSGLGRWVGEQSTDSVSIALSELRAQVDADPRAGLRAIERALRRGQVEAVSEALSMACSAAVAAHGPHGGPLRSLRLIERFATSKSDVHPADLLGVTPSEVSDHPGLPALRAALQGDEEASGDWARIRARLVVRLPPSSDELKELAERWEHRRRQDDLHRLASAHVRASHLETAAQVLFDGARRLRRADLRIAALQRAWALACGVSEELALAAGRQIVALAPSPRALVQLARVGGRATETLSVILEDLYADEELSGLQALTELLTGQDDVVAARLEVAAPDWSEAGHPAPPTIALLVALGCPLTDPDGGPACAWLAAQAPTSSARLYLEGPPPELDSLTLAEVLRWDRPARRTDTPWYRDLVGQLLTRRCTHVRGFPALHADFVALAIAWADTVRLADGLDPALAALERLAAHAPRHRSLRRSLSTAAVRGGMAPSAT